MLYTGILTTPTSPLPHTLEWMTSFNWASVKYVELYFVVDQTSVIDNDLIKVNRIWLHLMEVCSGAAHVALDLSTQDSLIHSQFYTRNFNFNQQCLTILVFTEQKLLEQGFNSLLWLRTNDICLPLKSLTALIVCRQLGTWQTYDSNHNFSSAEAHHVKM